MRLPIVFSGRRASEIRLRLFEEFRDMPHVLKALELVSNRCLRKMDKIGHCVKADDIEQLASYADDAAIEQESFRNPIDPGLATYIADLLMIGYEGYLGEKAPIARIRELGERLNEMGGLRIMRNVHFRVKRRWGPGKARELESTWGGVGSWRS